MAKTGILSELGEVLLPQLINQALAANDRVKYRLALLQTARLHADHPHDSFSPLRAERLAAAVDDSSLDDVVGKSWRDEAGLYHMPRLDSLHAQIIDDVRAMLAPLQAAAPRQGSESEQESVDRQPPTTYHRRLEALIASAPDLSQDLVPGTYIDALTSARPDTPDSLHLLVMHLHRELNQLQHTIVGEAICGAETYGLDHGDREFVEAFMRGVARTRRLKFDHPGLDTTAARNGPRLILQNDVGLTDAHVIVIAVEAGAVTITYTDVHLQRLVFFQNLFRSFRVQWSDTISRRSDRLLENLYHLCVGRFESDSGGLRDFLEFAGSRLVFLIDWNRARKRLRRFAPKRICLEVLDWAAAHELGHMAFLRLGGEQFLFDVLQLGDGLALEPGKQLSDILGDGHVREFLQFTLKVSSEGLLAGRAETSIRDTVRAELRHYLVSVRERLLDLAIEHGETIVELATGVLGGLREMAVPLDAGFPGRMARRAKKWEHRADEFLSRSRGLRLPPGESRVPLEMLAMADDAADELEEAAFRLTLLDASANSAALKTLEELAALVLEGTQEYLKAVVNARVVDRYSSRELLDDFLGAVARTTAIEHATDDALRRSEASILKTASDFRALHLCSQIANNLEAAADALMRSALMLNDHILREVMRT